MALSKQIWLDSKEMTLMIGLIPVFLTFPLAPLVKDESLKVVTNIVKLSGVGMFVLIILSLFAKLNIPPTILFFTIPGLLIAIYGYLSKKSMSQSMINTLIFFSAILLVIGYFETFFTLLNNLYPFPRDIKLFENNV